MENKDHNYDGYEEVDDYYVSASEEESTTDKKEQVEELLTKETPASDPVITPTAEETVGDNKNHSDYDDEYGYKIESTPKKTEQSKAATSKPTIVYNENYPEYESSENSGSAYKKNDSASKQNEEILASIKASRTEGVDVNESPIQPETSHTTTNYAPQRSGVGLLWFIYLICIMGLTVLGALYAYRYYPNDTARFLAGYDVLEISEVGNQERARLKQINSLRIDRTEREILKSRKLFAGATPQMVELALGVPAEKQKLNGEQKWIYKQNGKPYIIVAIGEEGVTSARWLD